MRDLANLPSIALIPETSLEQGNHKASTMCNLNGSVYAAKNILFRALTRNSTHASSVAELTHMKACTAVLREKKKECASVIVCRESGDVPGTRTLAQCTVAPLSHGLINVIFSKHGTCPRGN